MQPQLLFPQPLLFSVPQNNDRQNLTPGHNRFLPHLFQFITGRVRILAQKRLSVSSVCSHASARLPQDGHPLNLKLGPFMKICREYPNSVKTWHFIFGCQEVLLSSATENRLKIQLQRHTAPQCKNKCTVAGHQYDPFALGLQCYLLAPKNFEVAPRSYGNAVYSKHIGCFIA
jgi:hypothetical protein